MHALGKKRDRNSVKSLLQAYHFMPRAELVQQDIGGPICCPVVYPITAPASVHVGKLLER